MTDCSLRQGNALALRIDEEVNPQGVNAEQAHCFRQDRPDRFDHGLFRFRGKDGNADKTLGVEPAGLGETAHDVNLVNGEALETEIAQLQEALRRWLIAQVTRSASQTVRKNYSQNGECFGIRPIKLPGTYVGKEPIADLCGNLAVVLLRSYAARC